MVECEKTEIQTALEEAEVYKTSKTTVLTVQVSSRFLEALSHCQFLQILVISCSSINFKYRQHWNMKSLRSSVFSWSLPRSRVKLTGRLQRRMRRWSRSRGTARGWSNPCRALWTQRLGAEMMPWESRRRWRENLNEMEDSVEPRQPPGFWSPETTEKCPGTA